MSADRKPYAESDMTGEFPDRCEDCGEDHISVSLEAFEVSGKLLCEECAGAVLEKDE